MEGDVVYHILNSLRPLVQWLHWFELELHASQSDGGGMHGSRMSEVIEG